MKARMKDNLIMLYQTCDDLRYSAHNGYWESNELLLVKKMHGWLAYFETKLFLKSIEGKEVDLVFTGGDAFEKNDNNYWLPHALGSHITLEVSGARYERPSRRRP